MSIHIEDLTVRFKNSVTAIDHADRPGRTQSGPLPHTV